MVEEMEEGNNYFIRVLNLQFSIVRKKIHKNIRDRMEGGNYGAICEITFKFIVCLIKKDKDLVVNICNRYFFNFVIFSELLRK